MYSTIQYLTEKCVHKSRNFILHRLAGKIGIVTMNDQNEDYFFYPIKSSTPPNCRNFFLNYEPISSKSLGS